MLYFHRPEKKLAFITFLCEWSMRLPVPGLGINQGQGYVGVVCTDQVELFRKEERVYQPYGTDVRHHRPLPTAGRLLRL